MTQERRIRIVRGAARALFGGGSMFIYSGSGNKVQVIYEYSPPPLPIDALASPLHVLQIHATEQVNKSYLQESEKFSFRLQRKVPIDFSPLLKEEFD